MTISLCGCTSGGSENADECAELKADNLLPLPACMERQLQVPMKPMHALSPSGIADVIQTFQISFRLTACVTAAVLFLTPSLQVMLCI